MTTIEAQPPILTDTHAPYRIAIAMILGFITAFVSFRVVMALLPAMRSIPLQREYVFSKDALYGETTYSQETFFVKMEESSRSLSDVFIGLDSDDHVSTISPLIGSVHNVTGLWINQNPIRTLPDEIGKLTGLRTMFITNTRLTTLPDAIGNLTNLEDLSLLGNNLTRLPSTIGQLQNLAVLNLSYNRLESLPPSIGNLNKLGILDLTGNRLDTFPAFLPPNLNILILGDNPIPRKIIEEMEPKLSPMSIYY